VNLNTFRRAAAFAILSVVIGLAGCGTHNVPSGNSPFLMNGNTATAYVDQL